MSWTVANFREWATTILGLVLVLGDAALLFFKVWENEQHPWTATTAGGAILMLMVGLWLLGIKDFDPTKYIRISSKDS